MQEEKVQELSFLDMYLYELNEPRFELSEKSKRSRTKKQPITEREEVPTGKEDVIE